MILREVMRKAVATTAMHQVEATPPSIAGARLAETCASVVEDIEAQETPVEPLMFYRDGEET